MCSVALFGGHIDCECLNGRENFQTRLNWKFVPSLSFASCLEGPARIVLVKSCLNKIDAEASVIRDPALLIKRGSAGSGGNRECVGVMCLPATTYNFSTTEHSVLSSVSTVSSAFYTFYTSYFLQKKCTIQNVYKGGDLLFV